MQGLGDILIDYTDMVFALTEHMNPVKYHKLVLFNERIFSVDLHLLSTQGPRSLSRLCLSIGPQHRPVLNIGDPLLLLRVCLLG